MAQEQVQEHVISLNGIVKRFYIGKPNELEILHGINLEVERGEFVSIVGESGSGKSTLMNIIGALDRPTEGEYRLQGKNIGEAKDRELSSIRNQEIGFVFQTYNLIPRTTALENVELPMALRQNEENGAERTRQRASGAGRHEGENASQAGGAVRRSEAANGNCTCDGK